jgi:hypothetical protein
MALHRAAVPFALAFAFSGTFAAQAQTAPEGARNALYAATNGYFDAISHSDWRALDDITSNAFHVVLPDGKRISNEEFIRRRSAHYLISTTPNVNVKIGTSAIAATGATETVNTASFDYALLGQNDSQIVERDLETHTLTWSKSHDGKWQLDEDRVTSAMHSPG